MSFKKLPIVVQLITMLLIIMVIPTTITVYYSTVSLSKYSEEEIAESVVAQLKANSTLNERELFNLVQNVLAIAENSDLRSMKGITSYEILNSNYNNIGKGLKLLSHLKSLQDNNEMVESVVFIPEDWNYVISSQKSIVKKSEYEDLKWFNNACSEMKGVSGYWYPRMEGNTPVITYLYRLNRLTTSVKGVIVVNIYENGINTLLNYGRYKTDSGAFMMMDDGTVLSHKNKKLLFQNENLPAYILRLLKIDSAYGSFYIDENGERMLCAYYRPSNRTWIYGVTYPMKDMLAGVELIRNKQILLMMMIMAVGIVITLIYAIKFSRPMRQLADELKKKNVWMGEKSHRNEIDFLTRAFESIEREEEQLYLTLKEKEQDSKKQILNNLLSGEIDVAIKKEEIKEIFPYNLFMVAIITVDNRKTYLEKLDSRSRSYQRYLLFDVIMKAFPSGYMIQAVRYEGGSIAVIMNMEGFDQVQSPKQIHAIFKEVQKAAEPILKSTISIGISGVHMGYESIQDGITEAIEIASKKIFTGNNSILLWEQSREEKNKEHAYYYPYENAEKIQNYLSTCDLEGISKELDSIEQEILRYSTSLGAENVIMIFNQLAGSVIKFMMQRQINIGKIQGMKGDIYSLLSSVENVRELKGVLLGFCEKLIHYMMEQKQTEANSQCYGQRILDYLNEHYTEDLLYEEVAEQIGISYSYLRRIVKEETGKSVNDYINKIRIEKMKDLLLTTDDPINQIAEKVGYHNMQSVTRYFRKFEGITPKEFKTLNGS